MFQTTFKGQTVWVLDDHPNWTRGVHATVEVPCNTTASLSGLEERAPYARSLRWTFRFTLALAGEQLRAFDRGIRDAGIQPILIPFWPGGVYWGNRADRLFMGGIYWVEGGGQFLLYDALDPEPSWSSDCDLVYPVLSGFLNRQSFTRRHADAAEFDVEFTESSPIGWQIIPQGSPYARGPLPSMPDDEWPTGTEPFIFPYKSAAGQILEQIDDPDQSNEKVGTAREQLRVEYGAPAASRAAVRFMFSGQDNIANYLAFFRMAGGAVPFWSICWSNATVVKDTGGTPNELLVTDTAGIRAGDWMRISDGQDEWFGRVLAIPSNTALTMNRSTALPADMAARRPLSVMAVPLRLFRWAEPRLNIEWRSMAAATSDTEWLEVAAEYNTGRQEVMNVTVGRLPMRAWLFEFSIAGYNGSRVVERYTSFESLIASGGNSYAPIQLDHDSINQSLSLDRDIVHLTTSINSVAMLKRMISLQSESPVSVNIFEVDLGGAETAYVTTAVRPVFSGEVTTVKSDGLKLTADILSGGTILDRRVSRFVFKPDCNHDLFSVGCTLDAANWRFTANLLDPGTEGYPFTFALNNLGPAWAVSSFLAHFFAGGWIEFGTGTAWQRRAILDSTDATGGTMVVTLQRDPNPFPAAGSPVVIYPGCDGRRETCISKFNNYLNFGGHPFMPTGNPTLVKISTPAAAGGKK